MVDFHAFTFWLLDFYPSEIAAADLRHVSAMAQRLVAGFRARGLCLDFVEDGAPGEKPHAGAIRYEGLSRNAKSRSCVVLSMLNGLLIENMIQNKPP